MSKQFIFTFCTSVLLTTSGFCQEEDSMMFRKIYTEALINGKAYGWVDHLSNKIGHRLSGSPQAEKAVEWTRKAMTEIGCDTIYLQECMVPHWVRGEKEKAAVTSSLNKAPVPLTVCALGGSIGTGAGGMTGKVVEVKNFEELEKLGREKLNGRIVFYNRPMDPTFINTFDAYSDAVGQRWAGAMRAAPYGAVAVIVRSMTLVIDDFPHTGVMAYNDTIKKIPACAISTYGADLLSSMLKKDPNLVFSLNMQCKMMPEVKSYNVVGEIRGSEFPAEIITVGGHLDSWDIGQGAHDDAAGVAQSMEVFNIFKNLKIRPKRTIRVVAFMNEENGGRGGAKYAQLALQNKEKHILAIESDAGADTPLGFFMEGHQGRIDLIKSWKHLFSPYGLHEWDAVGGGADIGHLKDANKDDNIVLAGLRPDSQRYFVYHHSGHDLFVNVNRRSLELGAASMAALVYLADKYGLK